jgi:hypothetical protein
MGRRLKYDAKYGPMVLIFKDFDRDCLWGNPCCYTVVEDDLQDARAAHGEEMQRSGVVLLDHFLNHSAEISWGQIWHMDADTKDMSCI